LRLRPRDALHSGSSAYGSQASGKIQRPVLWCWSSPTRPAICSNSSQICLGFAVAQWSRRRVYDERKRETLLPVLRNLRFFRCFLQKISECSLEREKLSATSRDSVLSSSGVGVESRSALSRRCSTRQDAFDATNGSAG